MNTWLILIVVLVLIYLAFKVTNFIVKLGLGLVVIYLVYLFLRIKGLL